MDLNKKVCIACHERNGKRWDGIKENLWENHKGIICIIPAVTGGGQLALTTNHHSLEKCPSKMEHEVMNQQL